MATGFWDTFVKRTLLWLFAIGYCASTHSASAQDMPLSARMIADCTAVRSGQELWVGIYIQLQPDWHIYWEYPGESGFATKVEWDLSDIGTTSALTLYPVPIAFVGAGNLVSYGYEKVTILLAHVPKVAVKPDAKQVTLRARGRWLMCQAEECRDGRQNFELTLPVGEPAPSREKELIDRFRKLLPEPGKPNNAKVEVQTTSAGAKVRLEIEAPNQEKRVLASGTKNGRGLAFFPLPPKGVMVSIPEITGPTKTIQIGEKTFSFYTGPATISFEVKRSSKLSTASLSMEGVLVQQHIGANDELGDMEAHRFAIPFPQNQ